MSLLSHWLNYCIALFAASTNPLYRFVIPGQCQWLLFVNSMLSCNNWLYLWSTVCLFLASRITFVHRAVSTSTERHCTTHHSKRETHKTQMNESVYFSPNSRLSLTIVVVGFHQSSSTGHLSLFWSDLVNGPSISVMFSWVVCPTKQTLQTLKQPLHSCWKWSNRNKEYTNSIDGSLFMLCKNTVSIDNTSRPEISIQTGSRTNNDLFCLIKFTSVAIERYRNVIFMERAF